MTTTATRPDTRPDSYKWIALSNTTLGVLIATINSSILLIALPDIFRGLDINPLQPGNSSYLLWLMMGYMVVTAVLVVSFGRLGDMYGRVKMYNAGFAIFTIFSVALAATWMSGTNGVLWLIVMRVLQGVGGALLMANSSAIITDAFPVEQRGFALGLNMVAGIAGSFLGLVIGGILGPIDWRLVFLVSVPVSLFGTVWAYLKLRDAGIRHHGTIDWWGNVTFGGGLIAVLVGITYGIQPYGDHIMGWTSPFVLVCLIGGSIVLGVFCAIETRIADPMFRLDLFRIRAFTAGNLASLLSGLARGGLMFILIIWLQGIWLPRHGYAFEATPLWAGIFMLPMTVGFLIAGPLSGYFSDRFGARPFATGGMVISALSFVWLMLLPVNFDYLQFALALLVNGIGMGLFASLLGYNPIQSLLGSGTLSQLSPTDSAYLTGRGFFPSLISEPFHNGLVVAFAFAIVACLVAAVASWMIGKKYVHIDVVSGDDVTAKTVTAEPPTDDAVRPDAVTEESRTDAVEAAAR